MPVDKGKLHPIKRTYEVCYTVPGPPFPVEVRRRVEAWGLVEAQIKVKQQIAAEYFKSADSLKFQHCTRVN